MFKSVYKLKPGNSWRIGEHESWFTDMAEKGLRLQSVGIRFAKFKKAEPKKVKYRIEVLPKPHFADEYQKEHYKIIDDSQKSMYEEFGWTYVDSWKYPDGHINFHVFSSPEELNAPELHTDPVEQSYSLKYLDKSLRRNTIFVIINSLLLLGFWYSIINRNNTPYLTLINNPSLINPFLIWFWIYTSFESIKSTLSIRKLKRNLTEGNPLNHRAPWKKTLFFTRVMFIIYIALLVILIPASFRGNPREPLPLEAGKMPIILLSEIEDTNNIVRTYAPFNTIESSNWYISEGNFFAPIKYTTEEHIKVPNKLNYTKDGIYSSSLFTHIYKVRFKYIPDNLYFDLLKSNDEDRFADYKKVDHDNFDILYISEDLYAYDILASRGRGIIHLSYSGETDINTTLEIISQKLSLIE